MGTDNYYGILLKLMGKKLADVFDWLTMAYLLSMTVVMFAGSGATFREWNYSYMAGVIAIAVTVYIVMLFNSEGLMSIQSIIIPFLAGILIFVCARYLVMDEGWNVLEANGLIPWPSGITYAGLNVVPLIAVISTLGKEIKTKNDLHLASIISTVGIGLMAILMNYSLMKMGNQVQGYEIPLFSFMKGDSASMMILLSVMLWLAIYTTALSGVHGIVSRISPYFRLPSWVISLVLIILIIPLSQLGFSALVSVLYPIYGMLNLFVLGLLILYPINRGFNK